MPEEVNVTPPSEGTGSTNKKAEPTTYSGYKLTSDVWASLVTLLVGFAWPATLLILVCMIARHTDVAAIQTFITNLARDKQSVELSAGKEGLTVKIVALQVQNGLTRQIATETGQVTVAQQTATQRVAETAASQLLPQALQPPETRMKILWIDDHPQNNIGLQYAFQALGMIVVCVDTDAGISTSFATTGRFDLVITDMSRDAVGSRPAESEAGLKTIDIIKADYPGVPVVVYSGSYAAQHANDPLSSPVVAVTNDTQKVFDLAFDIASRKLK